MNSRLAAVTWPTPKPRTTRQRRLTSPGRQIPELPATPTFTAPTPAPRAPARGSPRLGLRSKTVQQYGLPDAAGWNSRPVTPRQLRDGKDANLQLSSTKELREKYHLKSSELRKGEKDEEWFHVARGWWANRCLDDTEMLYATVRILPDDVVISGETASLMYGIDVRPPSRDHDSFKICVVRPAGNRAVSKPGVHCRVMAISPDEWVTLESGVKVTTPLRTACNVAMTQPLDRAVAVLEGFLRADLVTYQELSDALASLRGRRGVCTLRLALKLVDFGSESPGETATRLRLLAAGLPYPESQIQVQRCDDVPVSTCASDQVEAFRSGETVESEIASIVSDFTGRSGQNFFIDLGWSRPEGGGVGVEYFGVDYHEASSDQIKKDRSRLKELDALGWKVLVVRSDDLKGDTATFEVVAAQLLDVKCCAHFREHWEWSRFDRRRNAWNRPA